MGKNLNARILAGYVLLSYPLFYYAYKFGLPDFGGEDFYPYYSLYKDWNFSEVDCPFNMRLISCAAIFGLNRLGFHYDTEIIFTTIHPDFDQQVFFNAVLFNYICVLATCYVIYRIIKLISENELFAFAGGCVYLLGFGTLFFSLKPISESCGILLLGLAFYFYLRRSHAVHLIFLLSVFQREYIFIVFGIMALIEFIKQRDKFFIWVLLGAVLAFATYLILRKTVFYTPRWDHQTSIPQLFNSLLHPDIELVPFIKQSILISNLLWIYLFVLMHKKIGRMEIDKTHLLIILTLLVQVLVMSIMTGFGNNAGRYFYYLSPVLIYYLFLEIKPLLKSYLNLK